MARMMKSITCMVLIAAVVIATVAPPAEAQITCGPVVSSLLPCLSYLTGEGPLGRCCNGITSLNNAAKTTADRRAVCNCLKSLVGSISGINLGIVAGLPGKCGVNIPYMISLSTDCAKVQ